MTVDSADLVPLRTWFTMKWRGYDREQVDDYVQALESDLMLVMVDRNASTARAEVLAGQVETLRAENAVLQEKLNRICLTPVDPNGLSERLTRMVELAAAERKDILRDAQIKAIVIVGEAEAQQQELAEQAARRREEEKEDFRLAMALRRAEAMRSLAELRKS